MKRLHKLLLWFAMLSKRLYKRPTFLVIMVMIPLLVLGYVAISGGESGMITIGLACRNPDSVTQEIFAELKDNSELLSFRIYSDTQEAETLLQGGKLDAVWIFPENMAQRIEAFSQQPTSSKAFITVLEREDNVSLMLSREKLNSAVYARVAKYVYVQFLRDLAPELSDLSDEQLLAYYDATAISADLFDFRSATAQQKSNTYLLSPLRGLLGTLILLCSLATSMYYIRDVEKGTFAWVNRRWQFLPELGCQFSASLHIAAICWICLTFSGLAGNLWIELVVWIMYSLCCSLFAMLLRQLCNSLGLLGTLLPLLIILVLVICPVFFDLGALRQLQYLLPATYYINAIHNSRYLLYLAEYLVTVAGLTVLVQYVKYCFRRH